MKKTPCQDCKPSIRSGRYSEGMSWECFGCGAWTITNGKATR